MSAKDYPLSLIIFSSMIIMWTLVLIHQYLCAPINLIIYPNAINESETIHDHEVIIINTVMINNRGDEIKRINFSTIGDVQHMESKNITHNYCDEKLNDELNLNTIDKGILIYTNPKTINHIDCEGTYLIDVIAVIPANTHKGIFRDSILIKKKDKIIGKIDINIKISDPPHNN